MKKVLSFILIAAVFLCLVSCTRISSVREENLVETLVAAPPGGDPLRLSEFCFYICREGASPEVVEGKKRDDGGLSLAYYIGSPDEPENMNDTSRMELINTIEGNSKLYEEISAYLGDYGVEDWNGFNGTGPEGIGENTIGGFTAVYPDGDTISAQGKNKFPSFFHVVYEYLRDMIVDEKLTATHYENGDYCIDLPESWIGVMTVHHGDSYISFETELGDGLHATLIIDDDTSGYQDSYDTAYRAGYLLSENKEEKPRYITVRENYFMRNYYDTLTEKQKIVCDAFDEDRIKITESITGTNGFRFIKEEGSVFYENDADTLFETARTIWLYCYLRGDYSEGETPVMIDGCSYLRAFPEHTGLHAADFTELYTVFSKVFTGSYAKKLIEEGRESGHFIENEGEIFVKPESMSEPSLYGGYYIDSVTEEKITVHVSKALPGDENFHYSGEEMTDFPVEKNGDGRFVFSDFPYWDRSE